MRLAPIERPGNWLVKLAYGYSRRTYGRVLTTLKVLYARKPGLLRPYAGLLGSLEKSLSLDASLRRLLKARIATINGCAFCVDLARHNAGGVEELQAKLIALDGYRTSALFSDRERAALAFVEQATAARRVDDATFQQLQRHFTESEIVELTWLNAAENFLNLTTLPLQIGSDGLCALAPRDQA